MSGPLWLEVPETWVEGKVKHLAGVTLGKMLQGSDSGDDTLAPYLRAANIQPDGVLDLSDVNEMWFRPPELADLDLRAGDVVVVEGGQGGFGRAAFVTADLTGVGFQNSVNRLRPAGDADGRYLAYYLIGLRSSGYIRAYCNVVSMPHLTAEKLAALPLPLPPLDQQRVIADYLDHETTQIDELIAEQKRLIDLLRERRGAVSELAVSSLDWSVPLRTVSRLIQTGPFGSQLKSEEYQPGGVPVINPSHIVAGKIVPSETVAVTSEKASELVRHALRDGDLVAARRGELGRCAVVTVDSVGYLCGTGSALIRPDLDRVDPAFLAVAFSSRKNRDALALASVGSTMDNLNADIIASLRVPMPSLGVQRRVVAQLVDQTSRIDVLIAEAAKLIELAQERRSALITATVTGQLDVRKVA